MNSRLNEIVNNLNNNGKMRFFEGLKENDILSFEKDNNIVLPSRLKEWYLYSDGGEFFLPGGIQLYGLLHKPTIDLNDTGKPNNDYYVIGTFSNGDSILCCKTDETISIYNHENGKIEQDEVFADFYEFLNDLPNILGIIN